MVAQAVVSPSVANPTRRVRVDSPQRWQAALTRALDNGVHVYQIASTGEWIATSTSKPGVCYRLNERDCECEASVFGNDPVCQHRAALRCELGILFPEAPDPVPPAPASPAAVAILPPFHCVTCDDSGAVTVPNRIRPDLTYQKPCPDCRAKGSIPTTAFLPRRRASTPYAA